MFGNIDLLQTAGVMMVVSIIIALFNATIAPGLLLAAFLIAIIGIIEKVIRAVQNKRRRPEERE